MDINLKKNVEFLNCSNIVWDFIHSVSGVSFINTHSSIILFERKTIVFGSMLVSFCLGETFGKITVARSAAVR